MTEPNTPTGAYPPAGSYPPPQTGHPGYPTPPPGYPATPSGGCQSYPMTSSSSDVEKGNSGGAGDLGFTDKSIRLGFIRKVYGILTCQLTATVGIVAFFIFHPGMAKFIANNAWLWFVALGTMVVTATTLYCCGDFRRKSPMNLIGLGMFTLATSFLTGCTALRYGKEEVFYAAVITLVVVVSLTLFAFQTSIDFTATNGVLFASCIIFLLSGIFCLIFPGKILTIIFSSIGALIFSVYIVCDTHMMMGGEHKYSLSPEEYIFAVLNLYLDILNLFMIVLQIIGILNDD